MGVAPVVSRLPPNPPTLYLSILERSGLQPLIAYGLGLPARFFSPSVAMKAAAQDNPKPIQAVFHSHSLRLHISDFGVDLAAVGPGMKIREMTMVMISGTRSETMISTVTVTVSGDHG